MTSRTIIIGGAGIGGLTAALALARRGCRVTLLDQAERLEETGAGIQLSPNATRILIALGLGPALHEVVVTPEAISVRAAHSGDEITRIPLGAEAERRYRAPYWLVHRADLQSVLLAAVEADPAIRLELGARVQAIDSHAGGVTVQAVRGEDSFDVLGDAYIGADGIWSTSRKLIGDTADTHFVERVAWRALAPADMAAPWMRAPIVTLWLGPQAHLVHYPVQRGRTINVVAIAADAWDEPGWSAAATPRDVTARFAAGAWSRSARDLIGIPHAWQKWALHERSVANPWGRALATLLGDAAHPVLPFLAQGAALAIEDAAVLAARLAASPRDTAAALRAYERERSGRARRVQRAARSNGARYHDRGALAAARNLVMRGIGGRGILARYDWLYGWRAETGAAIASTQ